MRRLVLLVLAASAFTTSAAFGALPEAEMAETAPPSFGAPPPKAPPAARPPSKARRKRAIVLRPVAPPPNVSAQPDAKKPAPANDRESSS
jgi:hypothetical protein